MNKRLALAAALMIFMGLTAASHRTGSIIDDSPGAGGSFDGKMDYSIPEYSSNQEILSLLVAPYLLVAFLLQITLQTFLKAVLLSGRGYMNYRNRKAQKRKIDKHATIMSLAIAAMLIPTPLWDYIIIAGSSLGVIAISIVLFVFLLIFYWVVSGGGRNAGE